MPKGDKTTSFTDQGMIEGVREAAGTFAVNPLQGEIVAEGHGILKFLFVQNETTFL